MLWRIAFPPLALQAAMFLLGIALLVGKAWLASPDHVPMNDEGLEAGACLVMGVVGFIIFIPLHWLVLGFAGKLRIAASRLHFILGIILGSLYLIPKDWVAFLVLLAPCFAFMGLMSWAAEAWIRRQETKEQQATDAFVLARKQMLKQPTKS